jgi:CYTH domain-containing protein
MENRNNTEIERKFLVTSDDFKHYSTLQHEIEQGYLCKEPGKTIRIRIQDSRAFITIKSSQLRKGIAKFEWEKEIDLEDAREMMQICLPGVIRKTRYIIPAEPYEGQERKWEVDVFHDRLAGRVLAEIELGSEEEPFARPQWLGEEVTGLPQYYNANM